MIKPLKQFHISVLRHKTHVTHIIYPNNNKCISMLSFGDTPICNIQHNDVDKIITLLTVCDSSLFILVFYFSELLISV